MKDGTVGAYGEAVVRLYHLDKQPVGQLVDRAPLGGHCS